ncbi:MAG: hypothetical protein GQ527_07440 [Bacteroidales bacterium]|nr:hypothetical protein [Bacteroidales bacterium]
MKDIKEKNMWEEEFKKNSGGFKMPDNYLDDLDGKILSKISSEKVAAPSRIVHLKRWGIIGLSIAASILFAVFVLLPDDSNNGAIMQYSETELEWDQYALFEESWIVEELGFVDNGSDVEINEEIDFLVEEDYISDHIIDELFESANNY